MMFHSKQDVDRHVNEVFKNIKSESQRNLKCYQIAKLYYKIKDYKTAIKYLNRYILATTNSAAAHRLLGECYLGANLKVKALDSFKASLELNGNQHDLVVKVCTLLMDPEVSAVTPRSTYWLERAESLFPTNPVVFQLREHILKNNPDSKQDNGQLEKLIMSEISARPTDVTVRIRLLNFFVETKRYKIAYQHALEIEERNTFSNDPRWCDCLCNLVEAYEKAGNDLNFSFFIRKTLFFERRADLFMQEFQDEVKTLPECSSALFAFDQCLHSVSKIEVPQEDTFFFSEFMKHMRAQLSFHLATLALKRAKKEYGIWPKAFRIASPLLLQATLNSMDLDGAWHNMWTGKNKMEKEIKQWNKTAAFRVSQAGHILLAWSQNRGHKFLEKVSQFCGGKWQNNVYQDIFYNRDHQQAMNTSHFINDPFFAVVPMRLLSETELSHFDEVSQLAYPDSLHHLVWLGLAYCNSSGQLNHDFRCTTFPDLQFSVENLNQTGPETLNQLDVDAFLYASVLCAKSSTPNIVSTDKPSRLPVSVSEELCSPAQADWWVAVYKIYKNQTVGNIADMRLKLRRGIETIRAFGQHGLHVKVIITLAKLFQERAAKNKNPSELNGLEERAYLYWTAAIPILEKVEKNQRLREVPNRLFDYRGKDLTLNEIKTHLEDGKLFLACKLIKQGRHEQAIEALQSLKSPYATFYQALVYEKLANEEVNHRPESITSENRSQHVILLTRARDAFYLTLDRLRCPSVDPNHPLNSQLQDHLEEIENQLAMIDPDSTLNRNGDAESYETDLVRGPLSPDVEENADLSFNIYNPNNFLNVKHPPTSRNITQNYSNKNNRFEARPSPERLDAQLRHLVQANSNGLQNIVEQLKEIKSAMQIELKDLGCVTRDLLAEMKRWNDRLESMSKKTTDSIKPEDLFELREEDYEDLNQFSQQYNPYQNYPVNRQIVGSQAPSTVTYGTPVPSPVPPVMPNPISNPDNSLVPPSVYPGVHPVLPIDPSLLFYQSLGYFAQGSPYSDNQNVPEYRGTGIQKGAPFAKNIFKAPDPVTITTTKSQPPNVVITSSDTLPAFTSAGTPIMSVTIPPQHIRGVTPSSTGQKINPFHIPTPPQEHLVRENPIEKLNALAPSDPIPVNQATILSGIKSTPVQQTTISKGVNQSPVLENFKTPVQIKPETEIKTSENKLFESKGKFFISEDKIWKEQGAVLVKILHDEKTEKTRLVVLQEPFLQIRADCYITADINLEHFNNNEKSWAWIPKNIQKNDFKPSDSMGTQQKLGVEFNSIDDAKNFESAVNKTLKPLKTDTQSTTVLNSTPSKNLVDKKPLECSVCKTKLEETSGKCSTCENKEKTNEKSNLGGFTFVSSPIVKPSVLKLNEQKEKPKETTKPGPFAEFSFATTNTLMGADSTPKLLGGLTDTSNVGNLFTLLSSGKADENSFKKDANFTFEGKNTPIFGNLNKPKTDVSKSDKKSPKNNDEGEEFVPTAEFTPVVELPDLVDVKTGEENDKILYCEKAKLLRFDTELKVWKERGVGEMKMLLNEESGKVRLIMRRELVLKVCCNHYLDENMEFKPLLKSDKALTWYAQDYSEGELTTELLALRFATKDSLSRFQDVLKSTQSKMKNGRMEGTAAQEPQTEKPTELKPLSELFKPKAGSWECSVCLIRNNENTLVCASCESPKPGTEAPEKEQTGLGKGIKFPPSTTLQKFGIPTTTTSATLNVFSTPDTSFTFGIPQTTTSTSSVTATNFTFGIPQPNKSTESTTSTSTPTTKFSFGTLNLGTKTVTSSTNTSIFETPKLNPVGTVPTSVGKPSFFFGNNLNTVSTTNTQSESTTSLSVGVTQSSVPVTSAPTTLSGFSFSTSNTKPSKVITFKNPLLQKPEGETPTFTFGIPKLDENAKKIESSNQSTLFGTSILKPKEKFEFSLKNIKPAVNPVETKSPHNKTGDGTASEDSEGEAEEDNGDHIIVKPIVSLPEKVELQTGEENEDVMYEHRAKLFRFTNKEWKERGIGIVKILKHRTNNKIRLLMRRETVLKLCLNHYVTPDIQFTPKDDKTWQWSAADFSEGEVRYDLFAIRFKTPDIAKEFLKALEDAKNNVSKPISKPELKAKEPAQAVKRFEFGVPNPLTSSTTSEISQRSQTVTPDDDILVLYQKNVTPEEKEKAVSLHLPPNFYSYLREPDCPGCQGCDTDDAS